ncbi:hypothetical protein BC833DRAFT_337761 [Globomyces pollinis-pini]|nr:hypothetical protein BC833DRAFT_337761 [Globomyces pollinis-pini]
MSTPSQNSILSNSILINSSSDFCLFLFVNQNQNISNTTKYMKDIESDSLETNVCRQHHSDMNSTLFEDGFMKSAHYIRSPNYVQITGSISNISSHVNIKNSRSSYEITPNSTIGTQCRGYKTFYNAINLIEGIYCLRCCHLQEDCQLGNKRICSTVPGNYSVGYSDNGIEKIKLMVDNRPWNTRNGTKNSERDGKATSTNHRLKGIQLSKYYIHCFFLMLWWLIIVLL